MSRIPEGSISTPEKTPSQGALKVVPCPTHTAGHPTVLVTQLAAISPPITPTRHQIQYIHSHASQSNSKRTSLHQFESTRDFPSPSLNSHDESFELKLWSLVPSTFRPQPEDTTGLSTTPLRQLQRRPSVSDIVDQSERLQSTPRNNRFYSLLDLHGRTAVSPTETASPPSPNNKRRNSDSSPTEGIKRRSNIGRRCSREPSTSPTLRPIIDTRDRNPFEVQGEHEITSLNDDESELIFPPLQHANRVPNLHYSSQQISKTSRKTEPMTPPTLRYRGMSLDPETPPKYPLMRFDRSGWGSFNKQEPGRFNEDVDGAEGSTGSRNSVPVSPIEAIVSADDPHLLTVEHLNGLATSISVGTEYQEGGQRTSSTRGGRAASDSTPKNTSLFDSAGNWKTPTRRMERRLSMSSFSTKSPPSATATSRQLHYRRHSFVEPDSPSIRTPTKSWRKGEPPNLPSGDSTSTGPMSSLMDSPSTGVQWSPSLETPVKKHVESNGTGNSPKNSIIQRLRGLQPSGPFDESATTVEGWSTLLETPPRKASKDKGLEPDPRISDDILDKLRGNPPLSRLSNMNVPNIASQDDSFHSASSSIVSETDEYQRELHGEPRGYPNNGVIALNDDADMSTQECYRSDSESIFEFNPKLEDSTLDVHFVSQDADVGLTLPSSLVHELEQESLSIGSQDFQSQILPESQSDVFASMPSAELNDDALSESNGTSEQQFQRLNDSPLVSRKPTQVEPNQEVAPPQANVLGAARDLHSQNLNARDMRIESWAASLPRDGQDAELGVRQETLLSPDSRHGVEPVELLSDDDFGSIRFSQLDDGFNVIPEATQRPQRRSPVVVKTAANHPHADEDSWLSTSASMLGDMNSNVNRPSYADDRKVQPSNMSGGFATAGGKKLAPLSKAALARVANLFEEDDSPSFNCEIQPPVPESDLPANVDTIISFTGFQTAGKKALLPISDTAREKVAFLFEDEDLDINPSRMTARNSGGVSAKPDHSKSMPLGPKNIQHQQIGGFTSGSGKKLAEPSKDIFEKWSKRFADDDDSDLTMPRATAEPEQPGRSIQPPVSRMQPMGFTGFSSGTGKALAPVSKAAQDRALSFLELNEPSTTVPELRKNLPTQSFSSSNSSSSSNSGSSSSTNGRILPGIPGSRISNITGAGPSKSTHQPVVSSHMNNLKLKSIRSTSTGPPSLSGIMKPLYKSKATFKSPLAFKPPLKKAVGNLENEILANGRDNGGNNDTPVSSEINSTKNPVSTKKLPNRRSTLHPNARPTLAEPPNLTSAQSMRVDAVTPSYTPLFDFQSLGKRSKLREVLGPPRQHSVEELLDLGVPHDVICMTLASAQSYRFDNWGVDEAYQGLITRGAVPHLLSNVWLKNHYGLIVWKLACYVRSWPEHFTSSKAILSSSEMSPLSWFSPTKVLDQLAYRYEREINRAERPALRRIVEGDDSAAKHMVLCIASITREYSEEIKQDVWRVTVTDGWYVLPVTLDVCLIRVLERGKKLKVGSKLHVCRAKLSGAENGVAILELAGAGALTTSVSIVLQANSTKLAGWDTKLGFQRTPLLWTTHLGSILPDGGLVPGLDVIVLRKYPVIYLETLADGTTKIKRTAREEEKAVEAHREQIQKQCQDIVLQVEREFGVGSQVDQGMIQEQIQSRAGELLQAGITTRNVMPFFSIRVGNYVSGDTKYSGNGQNQEALVTFWHSDHTPYQEGHRVRMTSLMARKAGRETGVEDAISLTGTRMTTVREMPTDPEVLLLTNYRPREIILCSDIGHLYQGAEIDMVVVILAFNETIVNSNKVYFIATDASKQLVLVEHQLSSTSSGADCQLPSFLKVRSRILMANARFKLRDHRLGLDIVSSLQTYTQVSLAPPPIAVPGIRHVPGVGAPTIPRGTSGWPAYAQPSLNLLNDLCNKPGINNTGEKKDEETLLELMAKANTILERMRPSF